MTDRWPPVDLDYGYDSNVRVVAGFTGLPPPIEDPPSNVDPIRYTHSGSLADPVQARQTILNHAATHADHTLHHLTQAVAWLAIVDPTDRSELTRQVEALADTIHYRASL